MTPPVSPTKDDLAFDQAFREAAELELTGERGAPDDRERAITNAELLERRASYRLMVAWIVGSAGVLTLIAVAISLVS